MARNKMGNPHQQSRFICLKHFGRNYVGDGIQRKSQRSKGHIKHLYCLVCKEVTPNYEVRFCDDWDEAMEDALKLKDDENLQLLYAGARG